MAEICSNDKNVGFIFTSERTKACLFLLFLSIYSRHGSLIDNSTARILPDDVSVFIDCFVVQTKYWLSKRRDQFSKDEKRDGFHFLDNWISIRGFAVYQNASGLETKRKCGAKSFSSKSWSKVRFFFFLNFEDFIPFVNYIKVSSFIFFINTDFLIIQFSWRYDFKVI